MIHTICLIALLTIICAIIYHKYRSKNGGDQDGGSLIEGFGRGAPGPQGAQGSQGPAGPRGIPGIRGKTGARGLRGPRGVQGLKGDKGDDGKVGPIGPAGARGERGFDGFIGPAGPVGPRGDKGSIGPAGPTGKDGPQGQVGKRGFPGLKGDPGTFAENSCKFFGSDETDGWTCPDSYPVFAGASLGQSGSKMYCSGGLAKNATCNGSSGTGARALAFINNGKIVDIKIVAGGRNYKFSPHVKVIAAKGYGSILKADVSNGSVTGITIIDGGQDHPEPPELQFETIDGGYGATASTIIDNGRVVAANIVHTGQNYQLPPHIEFRGGGGKGASAIAEINEGHVIAIRVASGGAGYTYPPVVVITPGVSKSGCSYCHMCCKKNPKVKADKSNIKQYEGRLTQTEQDLKKLADKLWDQHKMMELALKSNMSGTSGTSGTSNTDPVPKKNLPDPHIKGEKHKKSKPRPENPLTTGTKTLQKDLLELEVSMEEASDVVRNLDLHELDTYRQQLGNMEMGGEEKLKRFDTEKQRVRGDYKDWALQGKANQSSTYDNNVASNAISGNLDMYSQTSIGVDPNWINIELPQSIEIHKIVIGNRLGTFTIRERLPPFTLTVYNSFDASVGSKKFTGVQNEYIWDNVNLVGNKVKLTQELKNYLHINTFSVFGRPALECTVYEGHFMKYRDLVDHVLLNPSPDQKGDKSLYIKQRKHYKSLMESCNKLDNTTKKEKDALVQERAGEYDKIIAKQQALQQIKSEEAKKLWVKVSAQLKKEKDIKKQAQKLGLPPPPPMYTPVQVDIIKKNMKVDPIKMDDTKKAQCMTLLNTAMTLRAKADDYGRQATFVPYLVPTAKKYSTDYQIAWDKYNAACPGGEKPKMDISV